MAFVSGFVPGYNTSVVCVSPTQTAAIASFSRIWAQLAASIAPYQIGAITQTGAVNEWRIVFVTMIIISTVTGIFFQVFGSAEPQVFATSNSKSAVEEELIDNKKEVVIENCNGTAPLVSVNGSTPTGVE
ncbi:hypothetical protein WR25_05116 [Diploscapter pachys]|uniref:Major facilitator superfamily (MFS) profile domain-containing protein n=1 Tax=Diploscapter pachys TaxID=2018661 RepID=A0A2A2K539_9BILA|nr:hypothetical protein WR25_05116 [Diploscapter pachys]